MDQITLPTRNSTNEDPISIDPNPATASYFLDQDSVANRAFKASYGLANTAAQVNQPDVEKAIQSGQENNVRSTAASKITEDLQNKYHDAVVRAVSGQIQPLTQEDVNALSPSFQTWHDPKSIFELAYANQHMNEIDAFGNKIGSTGVFPAIKDMEDAQAMRMFGSINMAQHEYLVTKAQNVQSQINDQTNTGYALDFMKLAFPIFNPYYELKMRGNVPGVSSFDGLLGSNFDSQRTALMNMPFNKFTATTDDIIDRLSKDNPQAAMLFLAGMIGQTTSEKVLNNFNTVGNLLDIPTALGTAWALGRPIYNGVSMANQARNAYKTVLQANAVSPNATGDTVAAAVGDLKTAATVKFSDVLKQDGGTAQFTSAGMDQLYGVMRPDLANIPKNPGDMSTTRLNMMLDQYNNGFKQLMQHTTEDSRPLTLPFENFPANVIDQINKATFSRYPGMSNDIIKFEDMVRDPLTRKAFVPGWLGDKGGTFFTSEDAALQAAREQQIAVSYTKDQFATLEARIKAVKDEIKAGPSMDEDASGLNYHFGLTKQLEDLQNQLQSAKSAPAGAATIEQQGLGFYIRVLKPVDETDSLVRQWIVNKDRPESVSPDSWTKYIPYANYARTPEDTFSVEQRINRKLSVYPQNNILGVMAEEGKYLEALQKGEQKHFYEVLKHSQDSPDKDNGGLPGKYFDDPQELKDHYIRTYNEVPSERVVEAYFAMKRWGMMDHSWRNKALAENQLRWGGETNQVFSTDGRGNRIPGPQFVGKSMSEFPGGEGTNVLIVGDSWNESQFHRVTDFSVKQKKDWTEKIQSGEWKMVQSWDPEAMPFRGLIDKGDTLTHYVLSKNVETSPVRFDQIPYRGGGHQVYEAPLYVKVPIFKKDMGRMVYLGDRTISASSFTKDGQGLADKLNQVGVFIANDKWNEAKAFYSTHLANLESWDDFKAKWFEYKDEKGLTNPPMYDKDLFRVRKGQAEQHPVFQVVPRNKSILDINDTWEKRYGDSFRDGTRQGSPSRNFQIEFSGKRDAEDLKTVFNEGTQSNPIYNFRPAEKIDPVKIMTRSLSSIVHSSFMDPMKTAAIESWLQEAKPFVKQELQDRFASSPFWSFKTASEDVFKNGATPQDVQNLLANKFKIDQLVGTPSVLDTFLHSGAQALADNIYSKTGSQKLTVVPTWLLPKLRDPFSFMRSVAFNAYLGSMYLPQFFVQMMGFVNIHAISPTHAPAATMAMYLHQLSRVNASPEILNALDKVASTIQIPGFAKFRPGELIEAMDEFDKTGFGKVLGEIAQMPTLGKSGIYTNSLGNKILTLGQAPFREGERAVRMGAWYTAYLEHRAENPTGAITEMQRAKMLDRADLLYGNMSNASNSILHSGILSLPTQFFSYQIRLAEQFWGKRLGDTPTERAMARARLLAYNSAAFGVPVGLGITGLPISDWLREKMLEESDAADKSKLQYATGAPVRWLRSLTGTTQAYSTVNVDKSLNPTAKDWIEHMFMDGFPNTAAFLATNNSYNIGPRYGTQGLPTIRDLLFTDPSFWKLSSGASGQLLMNFLGPNKDGFVNAMTSLITRDGRFPPKPEDFIDLIKDDQSIKAGYRLYQAFNAGVWINNTAQSVMDVGKWNALAMTVLGLQPQLQTDIYTVQQNAKDLKTFQDYHIKRAGEEINRYFLAMVNKDYDNANDFFRRAQGWLILGNIPDAKFTPSLSKSIENHKDAIEQSMWSHYAVNPPKGFERQYMDTFSKVNKYLQQGTKQ